LISRRWNHDQMTVVEFILTVFLSVSVVLVLIDDVVARLQPSCTSIQRQLYFTSVEMLFNMMQISALQPSSWRHSVWTSQVRCGTVSWLPWCHSQTIRPSPVIPTETLWLLGWWHFDSNQGTKDQVVDLSMTLYRPARVFPVDRRTTQWQVTSVTVACRSDGDRRRPHQWRCLLDKDPTRWWETCRLKAHSHPSTSASTSVDARRRT